MSQANGDGEAVPVSGFRSSDPEALRALAHPLRLELLDLLDEVGEATATLAAERTSQTVANCSFHLRTLAKYGLVEACEQRGKEKPWRLTHRNRDLRPDPDDHDSVRAAGALGGLTVLRESERAAAYLRSMDAAEPELVSASAVITSHFWATPAELIELSEKINALINDFSDRAGDDDLRPEGARTARFLAAIYPEPHGGAQIAGLPARREADGGAAGSPEGALESASAGSGVADSMGEQSERPSA